jgi:putative glutamine amidotransferase
MTVPVRPLIGLPGRRKSGADIVGFPDVLKGIELDVYFVDYARGVLESGGLPVHLPLDADPLAMLDHLDGLVLTGGADLDPSLYGVLPETDLFPPEPARDRFEAALVGGGLERDVPMLGICRGLQLFNVLGGGSLHQHVPEHSRFDLPITTLSHRVSIEPGTRLADLFGETIEVNSLHHQTVDRVAAGWTVAARSDDGTVEAVELAGHDVIAVQWHPEMLRSRSDDPLFAWIVARARERAETRGERKEATWHGG